MRGTCIRMRKDLVQKPAFPNAEDRDYMHNLFIVREESNETAFI